MVSAEPGRGALRLVQLALVATLALFGLAAVRAGEVELDGGELVKSYSDLIERYRRHDPVSSPEGRRLVQQAAGWNLDVARMAARLAAMPPPLTGTVVRLDAEDTPAPVARSSHGGGRSPGAMRGAENPYNDDALDRALTASRSGRAWEDRALDGGSAQGQAPRVRVSAILGTTPRPQTGLGVCLIAESPGDCAAALKAAALLHTDVATTALVQGAHEGAATHRAIAGWLLWHLPQDARDDAFVRDWLLAVDVLLLGDGSLSSARQLGELGLARFPTDAALMIATAKASEALATLCYAADGAPVSGTDCAEAPVAFDGPQPSRPLLRNSQPLNRGAVARETERMLRELVKQRPADPELRLRLGRALAQRGRPEEAAGELSQVLTSSRKTGELALAHLLLGRLAEARKDTRGALDHARAAWAVAPDAQSARMALASALLASGDQKGAVELMAGLPTERPVADDPWTTFLQGSITRFVPARAALYARVKLP